MSYYSHDLSFKDNMKCSYVNKVSVKETSHVDFIYQFVKISCCTQNNDNSNTFVNSKIIETPSKITKYEDFKKRIYQPLYDYTSSSKSSDHIPQHNMTEQKYINIEFSEACFPVKVSLFARRNGFRKLKEIWTQNSNGQWFLLWNNNGRILRSACNISQLYTVILWRSCDFKTKMLKLRFCPNSIDHTKIDAAILIGTSEFILPKSPKQCLSYLLEFIRYEIHRNTLIAYPDERNVFNTTSDLVHPTDPHADILQLQQNFDKYCIIFKNDVIKRFYKSELGRKQMCQKINQYDRETDKYFKEGYKHRFLQSFSNKRCTKNIKPSSDESKELSSSCNISALPDEMVLEILKNLDVISLTRISRVNKRFNNLSRDPLFYKCLSLRNIYFTYMPTNFNQLFEYFAPRCKNLQQLDLSYCEFTALEFTNFFKTCCSRLTHLQLNNCYIIGDLPDIWKICKNLKELDLSCCRGITKKDISYLKNLQCLECLHLEGIRSLEATTLCEILKRNRHMRDLNLAYTFTVKYMLIHEVAIELNNLCPNLEKLNLAITALTPESIYTLSDCKNLKEVNFTRCVFVHVMNDHDDKIFSKLFSCCQRLEKINLNRFDGLTDRDLKTLTLCKNLKVLNLGASSVTPDICSQLFKNCPKLNEIDLSYCEHISESLVDQWNEIHNVIVYMAQKIPLDFYPT